MHEIGGLFRHLSERWRLDWKPSSMKVYSDKKRRKGKGCGATCWPSPFLALGCKVGAGWSPWNDFEAAETSMWKFFWMGAGCRDRRSLPLWCRMRDAELGCWPALSFRCPWWPMGMTLHSNIQALHRALIASMMRIPRAEGEGSEDYLRCRGRAAAGHAVRVGEWGGRVAARIVSWDDHVSRGHVFSWAVVLRDSKLNRWSLVRLAAEETYRVLVSRECSGRPHIRSEEGVRYCKRVLSLEV